jgi:hypothetical protein
MWAGSKTDRKISDKVRLDADAVGDTGRYVKNLLAGCDGKLKAARSAYAAARAEHYACTLPWDSGRSASDRYVGPRLLPNALFMEYLNRMSQLRKTAEGALDEFIAEYPALVTQAQQNLNGLANADDYPSEQEVRSAFKFAFDFQPIPASSQFRGLDPNAIKALGMQLERQQQAAIKVAADAMWGRARDNIEHLIERLEDTEGRFKATTVESVRDLIKLLPSLNVMGDDRVTAVVTTIDDMLRGIEAKDIRDDATVRSQVLNNARVVLTQMNELEV